MISSLSGASLALIITEPSLSAIHDLERIISLCARFKIPSAVAINKYDLDEGNTYRIVRFCFERGIEILARIPFDEAVPGSIAEGIPLVEYSNRRASKEVKFLWEKLWVA